MVILDRGICVWVVGKSVGGQVDDLFVYEGGIGCCSIVSAVVAGDVRPYSVLALTCWYPGISVDFPLDGRGCSTCLSFVPLLVVPLVSIVPCLGGKFLSVVPLDCRFPFWGVVSLLAVGSCSWMSLALVPLLG